MLSVKMLSLFRKKLHARMDLKMDIPEISLVELQQRVSPHTDLKMISPVTPPVVDEPEPATAGI